MNEDQNTPRRTESRRGLYSKFEPLAGMAVEKLQKLVEETRSESILLGAIKIILERTVPAIKAIEITGENGEPIKFNLVTPASYLSALGKSLTASTEGTAYGQGKIQSVDLAQTGEKDNNSNQSVSSVEST